MRTPTDEAMAAEFDRPGAVDAEPPLEQPKIVNRRYTAPQHPGRRALRRTRRTLPPWMLHTQRRRTGEDAAKAWTGTDLQRERTTTDPEAFIREPEQWDWFLDRVRGHVFTHPAPDPLTGVLPSPLPRRYMRQLAAAR